MKNRKIMVWLSAIVLLLGTTLYCATAEAKSFRSSSSFKSSSFKSSPSKTSSWRSNKTISPKPKPVTVNKTQRTTVVQNNTVNQGSGLMGTVVGTMAGSMAGNYLYDSLSSSGNSEAPVSAPVAPPQVEPKDTTKPVCPENFLCDFEKGKFYDLTNGKLIDYSKPITN